MATMAELGDRAIAEVLKEHPWIGDILAEYGIGCVPCTEVPPEVFERAADLIRTFADGLHHAKEEAVLFRELAANGMPTRSSPIEAMLIEHDQGRAFVKGVANGAERLRRGESGAARQIATNALGYATLLRQHIQKEDNILYPLAERFLPPAAQAKAREGFRIADESRDAAGLFARCRRFIADLEERLGTGDAGNGGDAKERAGMEEAR